MIYIYMYIIHTRESPTIAKRRSNIRCTRPNIEDLTAHYSGLEAGQEVDRTQSDQNGGRAAVQTFEAWQSTGT